MDAARGRLTGRLVAALRAPAAVVALDVWARALRAETAAQDSLTLARLGEGTR